ncbi:MAG TPA: M48 family metallopeptidase [Rhizomicrobium sp.]|nr:M48 family metallopeptidase [Rhizomicrobium sp.]
MFAAHGLYGHIRNNDLRATALLAGFAIYIAFLWLAGCLFYASIGFDLRIVNVQLQTNHQLATPHWIFGLQTAEHVAIKYAWLPVLLLAGWLAYAWLMREELIRQGTAAQRTPRSLEPELYNMVEALAIGAGLPMPGVEIIETDALNACASGWTPADSAVTVTRGLLHTLSSDELEAVLAHEMTHIRCRDVRLMTVAGIFVGFLVSGGRMLGGGKTGASTRNLALRTSGGAGIFFVLVAAVIAALSSGLAVLSRLALSRTREFVADAGAVTLTKNPDALISALRKIAAHGEMPALPDQLRAMMIFSAPKGWRATHPSIESRIAALETYAGGTRAAAAPPTIPQQGLRRAGAAAGAAKLPVREPRPFGRRASASYSSGAPGRT